MQLQALGRAGPPSQSQGAQHGQHGQISPTKSVDGENEAKKEGGEVKDVSTNSGEGDKPKASVSSKEYMEYVCSNSKTHYTDYPYLNSVMIILLIHRR